MFMIMISYDFLSAWYLSCTIFELFNIERYRDLEIYTVSQKNRTPLIF